MIQQQQGDLLYYRSPGISTTHGFSTKLGGVSQGEFTSLNLICPRGDLPEAVAENYARFHQAVGFEGDRFARNSQVHGDKIVAVCGETSWDFSSFALGQAKFPSADGLMTQEKDLALWVYGADCVTMLFHDPVAQVVAALHSGWRGTAMGIAQKMVQEMGRNYGCLPQHIQVALGPSIGQCCFSCHEDVPLAMEKALGSEAKPWIKEEGQGKYGVDLWGLNVLWLEKAGVQQIDSQVPCTACHPQLFWSHRVQGDERGSMGGMIAL